MRKCAECGKDRIPELSHLNKTLCEACRTKRKKEYRKQYRENHQEYFTQYNKEYYSRKKG